MEAQPNARDASTAGQARHRPDAVTLPAGLVEAIDRAGYYPTLVSDVVLAAMGDDEVVSHLVHQETTFDQDTVRRHLTVLAVTPTKLVIAHVDDHNEHEPGLAVVTATSETVPIGSVRGVMLTHVVAAPDSYVRGALGRELTLTIGWGAVSRLDLVPATCGDPDCDADHGFEGTVASDDISLRISADADGDAALAHALRFSRMLSSAIGGGESVSR
ncbi:MAG: DUF5998 family protein [Lapillicoccus sp.]